MKITVREWGAVKTELLKDFPGRSIITLADIWRAFTEKERQDYVERARKQALWWKA